MTVYLLHFDNGEFMAEHYIGFTGQHVLGRFMTHAEGYGSRFTRVKVGQGKEPILAHTWPTGSLKFEGFLHGLVSRHPKYKHVHLWCPVCGYNRIHIPKQMEKCGHVMKPNVQLEGGRNSTWLEDDELKPWVDPTRS